MVKRIKVRAPGTCGEWIQTYDPETDKECLVSLPINRYNDMILSYGDVGIDEDWVQKLMPKSRRALSLIAQHLALSEEDLKALKITTGNRELAVGKGMASSTADLIAIMTGVAWIFEKSLSPEMLLELCCQIEPTDSLMFEGWALIDHLEGKLMGHYPSILDCDIVLLSPGAVFETELLRKAPNYKTLMKSKSSLPLSLFKEGMTEASLEKLGMAATLSLLENESILKKNYLNELVTLSEQFHCYGIAGGHSGTVTGLIVNPSKTDLPALLSALKAKEAGQYYQEIEIVKAIGGGCELTILEV